MSVEKLIIIGSGPAGHTAAIYASRAMLSPLMFEWFLAWWIAAGGQLTTTTDVENFPWFPDGIEWPVLMDRMRLQSLQSWTRILTKTVDSVDLSERPFKVFVWDDLFYSHSLIIATGAVAKRLHLPGENIYRQRWVSACAVCDWALPIFRNKALVVIGWGDSACEESIYLTKYADKVFLLVRKDYLRASKVMQDRVFANPKIEILWNIECKEIRGDEKLMNSVLIINNKTQKEEIIAVSWLFYAIWHTPNTDFLSWQISLDSDWYIVTRWRFSQEYLYGNLCLSDDEVSHIRSSNHHFETWTSVEWVFAAGDVADKFYRQAITSAGTGCMAALNAEHYLQAVF